jgi:hypothetical protein
VDESYKHTFRTFAHSPRPMMRSLLFELERAVPELFGAVRTTVFRAWNKPTIVSDFVMRWALASGQAKLREHSHLYISTGAGGHQDQLDLLSSMLGKIEFFCINDTMDDAGSDDPRFENVRSTLALMFPLASSFEK